MAVAQTHRRHLGLALAVIGTAQLMVILDASIVNVALPSVQKALHFGGANLEWVVNAYTLAFGGLLLLGGRTGDLFGRRRMFMIGVGLFALASLFGGLATNQAWLITSRAAQGVGGAIASPTALALIASTFAEGTERNRAMGVYGAMSGAGGAIGVLLGGVLTDLLSWRWVLFVNVPIGLAVVAAAPLVLPETGRTHGRLDLPGAVTATAGMTFLVYGLVHASTSTWGSTQTVVSLMAAAVLLGAFLAIEVRTPEPLLPLHLFAKRSRTGAYLVMLAIGTGIFSMFYFLTLFMQDILGFSPLRTGLYYLPFAVAIMIVATVVARLVGKVGPRPLIMAGTLSAATGLFLLSQVSQTTTYLAGLLGPMMLIASGMAACFVPLTLTAVSGVAQNEVGIASAVLNSGQQVGGSLGLAVIGTVAATVTRNLLHQVGGAVAHLPAGAGPAVAGHLPAPVHHAVNHAFVSGYTTAFQVSAAILIGAFIITALTIRVPSPQGVEAPAPVPA